jgi:tetratricopeptide (TPR) repeat protein
LSLLILASQTFAEVDLVNLVKKIQPAVVTVIAYDIDKKPLRQGSGFFVDKKGHLITNYHVLKGAHSAKVKTYGGKTYFVKSVVAENETTDLLKVLVDIPETAVHWAKVSGAIPAVAEHVLVIGSPMGLEQSVSEGIVSAVREVPEMGQIFQLSAPISPGSSGSPVVNMKGEVIGVATFQLVEGQNLNFAVPGGEILEIKHGEAAKTILEWTEGESRKRRDEAIELTTKGDSYSERGEFMSALEAYKQAIRVNSDNADAHYKLGRIHFLLGQYTDAIGVLKQAIRINPDNADAHRMLGGSYSRLGQNAEAIEAYKQAIRINPGDGNAHVLLGDTYSELGQYTDAIGVLKQAIRINPGDVGAYHTLGNSYLGLRQYADAIEAYKQAIRINPDHTPVHYNLGLAYSLVGNKGAALEEYKILKRLDPNMADKLFNAIYK